VPTQDQLDDVYAQRNRLALAFASLAADNGWAVGVVKDPDQPFWPVLIVDTPRGQVSWHLRLGELPAKMPVHPGGWDGHTTDQRDEALRALTSSLWGGPALARGADEGGEE